MGQAESYFHLQVQKLCQINHKKAFVHDWQWKLKINHKKAFVYDWKWKLNSQHEKLNEKLFIDSSQINLIGKLLDFRS